jgi:UDP-glucose 4-epimerase
VRDYVHVEDIADAHVQAVERKVASDVFNLGTKAGASNKEIISAAEKITGKILKIKVGPRRPGDPAILTASADRWHDVSGWAPRFGLEDMISHAWAWYVR